MIFGIGTDIVEIDRIHKAIQRFDMAFCYRVLHAKELECMPSLKSHTILPWLSARFAAKEAAVKALGTGFRNGITLKSIATVNNTLGKPELLFFDKAYDLIQSKGITHSYISLSHEKRHTIAFVVLEKN